MISCVYCGGEHDRPAEVKQCWARQRGSETDAGPGALEPGATGVEAPHDRHADDALDARPDRRAGGAPAGRSRAHRVACAARRGPSALGRHVVVRPGQVAPADWIDADRVVVDDDALAAPGDTIVRLRDGPPAVVELVVDLDDPPASSDARPVHEVGVVHEFELDELHHLVWENSIDVRSGDPHWTWIDRAVELGAQVGGRGDVVLPDGREVWVDGGPVRHLDPIDGVEVVHRVSIEHGSLEPPRPNVTAAELADDQLAAVTHPGGAARIIAPAGSGKTRVLTERARQLLQVWRIPPTAVTLVAFNKRAQEEMLARTADLHGLQVRTLNSLALAIANGTPPFAPQPRRWRTIDEPEARRAVQRFVTVPRRRNTDPIAPWLDALGAVRLGLLDPATVEARAGGEVDGLAKVYPQYVEALERAGVVDFDGQIDRALRVLLTQPDARRTARRACRVLLVDEFQDLAPAHLLLVRLLAGPDRAVFGVGDDDQTIYGYQGADPGWLIDFDRWFPGAGDHPLEVNYRCPGGVVEIADRLLRHNRRRVPKTIRAASADPGGWSIDASDDPVGRTVAAVVGAIDRGAPPAEIAVLTRVNSVLAPVQVALWQRGVPVRGGVGPEFLDRAAVRAALAWLRLAGPGPWSADDLDEALRRPSRSVHPRVADWIQEQPDVRALRRLAIRLTSERDAAKVVELADDIDQVGRLADAGVAAQLDHLVRRVGLGGAVATLDEQRRGMNRTSQGDDLVALEQLAALHDGTTPFAAWLREALATPGRGGGVTLSTVHRVKGREWPHVVVHFADDHQFPHRLADDHEEERRLFHVAITRAGRDVTVVSSQASPSPFVDELTREPDPNAPTPPRRDAPTTSRPTRTGRRGASHPLLDRERVMAVPGLVLVDQGHDWVVTEIEPAAVVARRGDAIRRFDLGSKVETRGRQRGRLAPRSGDLTETAVRLFDLLRVFRDRVRDGKPAYTVFDDKTLAAIAAAAPSDPDQLADVSGVGPVKLERYGDAVLELVVEASRPSPTAS